MAEQSKSPLPQKLNTINFASAMQKILKGKKIHKLEWKDKKYYGILDNTILKLHKPDGKLHNWIINEGDIIGEDYIVIS